MGTYELKPQQEATSSTVQVEVRVANVWFLVHLHESVAQDAWPKFIKMGVLLAEEQVASNTKKKSGKATASLFSGSCTHESMQNFDDAWRVLGRLNSDG